MAGRVKNVLSGRGKAGVVLKFVTGPNAGKTATSGSDGTFHFTSLQQVGLSVRHSRRLQLCLQWAASAAAVDRPCTPSEESTAALTATRTAQPADGFLLVQDGLGRLEGRASGFETFVDEFVLRNRSGLSPIDSTL